MWPISYAGKVWFGSMLYVSTSASAGRAAPAMSAASLKLFIDLSSVDRNRESKAHQHLVGDRAGVGPGALANLEAQPLEGELSFHRAQRMRVGHGEGRHDVDGSAFQ